MDFSPWLLEKPIAKSKEALDRIYLAKRRIQSILDRHVVCHQKTLEKKVSEQGPNDQRVDPHLVGLAIKDLKELRRIKATKHPETKKADWLSNPATDVLSIQKKLNEIAPLYAAVTGGGFGNLTGDALEVVTYKCLESVYKNNNLYSFLGHFRLSEPKINQGELLRFNKVQPPKSISGNTTEGEADFIQFGHRTGPLCVECKNYREWIYPHHEVIKELIIKSYELDAIPVLITRRLHYTTMTNLFEPAGIISHEAYHQYYPSDKSELAEKVRDKRSLGFTDVLATEDPQLRTLKFFSEILPRVVDAMSYKWKQNKSALLDFANNNINLAQLYTEIGSVAGGKWQNFEEQNSDDGY